MSGESLPIDEWLEWAVKGMKDVVNESLCCEDFELVENVEKFTSPFGAWLPIKAGNEPLHIGILSSEDGCSRMTRSLLFMEPDEDDPSQEDMADAVGEIVNIIAGIMQRDLAGEVPEIELGLPIFVAGEVVRHPAQEAANSDVMFNGTTAKIVVLRAQKTA